MYALETRNTLRSSAVVLLLSLHATACNAQPPQEALRDPVIPVMPVAYDARGQQLVVGVGGEVQKLRRGGAGELTASHLYGILESAVLRLRVDAARNRLWILGLGSVHVLDLATRRPLASIALPGWMYVEHPTNCLPDLQLDRQGAAYVSDNAQRRLWRVEAERFSASSAAIELHPQTAVDAGFSALHVADDGVILAAMAAPGTLWRIDRNLKRGRQVPLSTPIHGACAIETAGTVGTDALALFVLAVDPVGTRVRRIDRMPGALVATVKDVTAGAFPGSMGMVAVHGTLQVVMPAAVPATRAQRVSAGWSTVVLRALP